jgi:AraC family transcriptional regulator of adaptative response/methylated-DNA-[protein]-cysteine methyltransferase
VISKNDKEIYYQSLLNKDPEFEGTLFVGVKTTGVFCRPTCPARKPKFINCEFFGSAKEAMLASYRACQRCQPNQVSPIIKQLVEAVEANPEKCWKDKDFAKLSIMHQQQDANLKNDLV